MIYKDDDWVSICDFKDGELYFTPTYLEIMTPLCGGARKFASQLITGWGTGQEFEGLLDYFGPDDREEDTYTGLDTDAFDVREDIPTLWEIKNLLIGGLSAEWYRDILRSKLATFKIPKRILEEYVKKALANNKQ